MPDWTAPPQTAARCVSASLVELATLAVPLGVKVGLEHAGDRLPQIRALFSLGLDYVKLGQPVEVRVTSYDSSRFGFLSGKLKRIGSVSNRYSFECCFG